MTMTREDRNTLDTANKFLSPAEQEVAFSIMQDIMGTLFEAKIPFSGDDRCAALEAAIIRYIIASKQN